MKIKVGDLKRVIKEEIDGPSFNEPCPKCGSENTQQLEPVPSMAGYGVDSGLECLDCGNTSFDGPEMHDGPPRARFGEATRNKNDLANQANMIWKKCKNGRPITSQEAEIMRNAYHANVLPNDPDYSVYQWVEDGFPSL